MDAMGQLKNSVVQGMTMPDDADCIEQRDQSRMKSRSDSDGAVRDVARDVAR